MPYATLAEAFASPIPIKQSDVPQTHQEYAKHRVLFEPIGANVPQGTPVEWRQTIPQGGASMNAGLPDVQSGNKPIYAPGPNVLAVKKQMEPVPNSSEPLYLPPSVYEEEAPVKQVQDTFENFADMITLPGNRDEWSVVLRKILAIGIENGWMIPRDLVVLFQQGGQSKDWNIWLQEMIPYVFVGAFLIFFLNIVYKLFT